MKFSKVFENIGTFLIGTIVILGHLVFLTLAALAVGYVASKIITKFMEW